MLHLKMSVSKVSHCGGWHSLFDLSCVLHNTNDTFLHNINDFQFIIADCASFVLSTGLFPFLCYFSQDADSWTEQRSLQEQSLWTQHDQKTCWPGLAEYYGPSGGQSALAWALVQVVVAGIQFDSGRSTGKKICYFLKPFCFFFFNSKCWRPFAILCRTCLAQYRTAENIV